MSSTCNKTSNNKYFYLPARMNDGRTFTDYRPSNTVNDMIRYSNNVMSSYEYRQFLIHNAVNLMKINNQYTDSKVKCNSCNSKEINFNETCDYNKNYSLCSITDKNGVGLHNLVSNKNN